MLLRLSIADEAGETQSPIVRFWPWPLSPALMYGPGKAQSLDTAEAIVDADPGVRSGIFVYRIALLNVFYPWRADTPTPEGGAER